MRISEKYTLNETSKYREFKSMIDHSPVVKINYLDQKFIPKKETIHFIVNGSRGWMDVFGYMDKSKLTIVEVRPYTNINAAAQRHLKESKLANKFKMFGLLLLAKDGSGAPFEIIGNKREYFYFNPIKLKIEILKHSIK